MLGLFAGNSVHVLSICFASVDLTTTKMCCPIVPLRRHYFLLLAIVIALFSFGVQESQAQIYSSEAVLVVSSILVDPYLRLKKDVNQSEFMYTEDYEGYAWDLADLISRRLGYHHFRFNITDKYGRKLDDSPNGDWDGIIGAIKREEAHIGIAPLTLTKERSAVVDFSTPFLQFQLGILQTKDSETLDEDDDDEETHDGQHLFLDPFTPWLWLVIIGTSLVLLILIFFIEKCVSLKLQGDERTKNEKLCHHFCSRVFGAPRSIATRILQIAFWIWVILIFCAYTANFAANRFIDLVEDHSRLENDEVMIESLDDLLKNSKIEYGVLNEGSTFMSFMNSKNPVYSEMFQKMNESDNFVSSYQEGIEAVSKSNGTFVYIGEAPLLKHVTLQKPCKLALAPKQFGPKRGFAVATAIPKPGMNAEFSKRVNYAVLELKEKGLLEDLEQKWFSDRTQCPEAEDDDDIWREIKLTRHEPLDAESMAGVFYFLVAALIIFFIIAVIELHLIAKFRKQ